MRVLSPFRISTSHRVVRPLDVLRAVPPFSSTSPRMPQIAVVLPTPIEPMKAMRWSLDSRNSRLLARFALSSFNWFINGWFSFSSISSAAIFRPSTTAC